MVREIIFDTETTGVNCFDGDRIIEIGCVELIDKQITGREFHTYLNPEKKLSYTITKLTHITDKMLEDKPLFIDIYEDFLNFINNDILVAHNAKFDINFINNELSLIGKKPLENEVIDTLEIVKKKFHRNHSNSLDNLCDEFKINKEERENKGHGALLDSQLLAELYIKILNTNV